jgi:hypothetical protein
MLLLLLLLRLLLLLLLPLLLMFFLDLFLCLLIFLLLFLPRRDPHSLRSHWSARSLGAGAGRRRALGDSARALAAHALPR